MLSQIQIDSLTAEEYSSFLSNEEEFCVDHAPIAYDRAHDLYTNEHLGCLGGNDYLSDGGQDWIGSLVSTMFQDVTSGFHNAHCIST